jgi:2',5'-phosphodiesterase
MRDVCRLHGGALALSSANLSGGRSPVDTSEFRELWPQCEAVFDGGTICGAGRHGSTIIDLSEPGCFRILRRGDDQLAAQYAQQLRAVHRLEQKK